MANSVGLEKAIHAKDLKRIQKLLPPKAQLNRALEGGYPALVVAATTGSAKTVQLLMEAGADPRQRCRPFQETALHFATTPAAAEALIDAGADINAASQDGNRPLHAAVSSNLPSVVDLLLHHGADPDVRCEPRGDSPLHLAVRELRTQIIKRLLHGGANPDVRDDEGATPLNLAALMRTKRVVPIITALLGGGANVDLANDAGISPLMTAAMNGEPEVVRVLIKAGASLNAQSKWKETALSHAVYIGRVDVVKLLIKAGADAEMRISKKHPDQKRRGQTARELAEASNNRAMRSCLA